MRKKYDKTVIKLFFVVFLHLESYLYLKLVHGFCFPGQCCANSKDQRIKSNWFIFRKLKSFLPKPAWNSEMVKAISENGMMISASSCWLTWGAYGCISVVATNMRLPFTAGKQTFFLWFWGKPLHRKKRTIHSKGQNSFCRQYEEPQRIKVNSQNQILLTV